MNITICYLFCRRIWWMISSVMMVQWWVSKVEWLWYDDMIWYICNDEICCIIVHIEVNFWPSRSRIMKGVILWLIQVIFGSFQICHGPNGSLFSIIVYVVIYVGVVTIVMVVFDSSINWFQFLILFLNVFVPPTTIRYRYVIIQ